MFRLEEKQHFNIDYKYNLMKALGLITLLIFALLVQIELIIEFMLVDVTLF